MLKEIYESTRDSVKDKLTNSVMYGTFVTTWLIWNWKFIYITFFVDQGWIFQKTQLLKIEYLVTNYPFTSFWTGLCSISHLLILPATSSFVIVFLLSKLDFIFFAKHRSNIERKKSEELKYDRKRVRGEREVLKGKEENIRIEKRIDKEIDQEKKWATEFESKKYSTEFNRALLSLKKCIYENQGDMRDTLGRQLISPDHVAYLDTNSLITLDSGSHYLKTTQKGKYFLSKIIKKKLSIGR